MLSAKKNPVEDKKLSVVKEYPDAVEVYWTNLLMLEKAGGLPLVSKDNRPRRLLQAEKSLTQKLRQAILGVDEEIARQLERKGMANLVASGAVTGTVRRVITEALKRLHDTAGENIVEAARAGRFSAIYSLQQQGVSQQFTDFSPAVAQRIREQTGPIVEHVQETMTEDFTDVIVEGYREGKNTRQVGHDLQESYEHYHDHRTERVARTETHSAQNQGKEETYQDLGIRYEQWLTAQDTRVRGLDEHDEYDHAMMHGQVIRTDDVFKHPQEGWTINYPGDKSAALANFINCRCTTRPYIPDREHEDELRNMTSRQGYWFPPAYKEDYSNQRILVPPNKVFKGAEGSGHHGHGGAPGMWGGSSSEYTPLDSAEECEEFLEENGHVKDADLSQLSPEAANEVTKAVVENPHLDEPLEGIQPFDGPRNANASVRSDGIIRYNPQGMHDPEAYARNKERLNQSDKYDQPDMGDIEEAEQNVAELENSIYEDIPEDRHFEAEEILEEIEEAQSPFAALDASNEMNLLLGKDPDDPVDERVEQYLHETSRVERLKEEYERGGPERYSTNVTVEETITHEIGHELTRRHANDLWQEIEEDGEVVGIDDLTPEKAAETEVGREYNMGEWDNEEHQEIKNELGQYSQSDLHEYVAESYTAIMHDKYEVHDDMKKFIAEQLAGEGGGE